MTNNNTAGSLFLCYGDFSDTYLLLNSVIQVTNARWWGAPGPLFCGPKTQYPHTGYWDYSFECNNQWANPPIYCDDYEGQKGGKHIDNAPYANAAGRIDVEGCCWWGRGGRLLNQLKLFHYHLSKDAIISHERNYLPTNG